MKPITAKEFKKAFTEYQKSKGTSYKQLDDYTNSHTKMRFKCSEHGIFEKTGAGFLRSLGCPACVKAKSIQRTNEKRTESFIQRLKELQPNISLREGTFQALGKKAEFKCSTHGYFSVRARSALDIGCQTCNREAQTAKSALDRKVWEERIKEKHGNTIRLLGTYRGCSNNSKYRFKCYVCFNTWKAQLPAVGLHGDGCPYCANKRKGSYRSKAAFAVKTFELDGVTFRVQGWEFQAICWLLEKRKIQAREILTESSGEIPVFRYRLGRRFRNYYPDMFVPKWNKIIEVKSNYTLGLASGKKAARSWRMNQAKAKAVLEAGYKFTMMLMLKDGTRCALPKRWYEMTSHGVLTWLALHNGDAKSNKNL